MPEYLSQRTQQQAPQRTHYPGARRSRLPPLENPEASREYLPDSPELNPIENFWKVLKQQGFYNQAFDSLDQVEDLLEDKLKYFEDHPQLLQSVVGYAWIIDALNS